jgi:hypothetical protein
MRACTLTGGGELYQGLPVPAARRREDRRDEVDEQLEARLTAGLGGASGPVEPLFAAVELAAPDQDPGDGRLGGGDHRFGIPARPGRLRNGVLAQPPGLGGGSCRSSISAIGYSAAVRSLPENSGRTARGRDARLGAVQPAAARPPSLRSLVQGGHDRVGQLDPGGGQESAGLVRREAQLRGADLGQFTGEP